MTCVHAWSLEAVGTERSLQSSEGTVVTIPHWRGKLRVEQARSREAEELKLVGLSVLVNVWEPQAMLFVAASTKPQVLIALHESCWEVSSDQLCKEATVPQLNHSPPHDEMLSWNLEWTFCLVTDLKWPRRWRKYLFASQWRSIWAPEGHLPRPRPFSQGRQEQFQQRMLPRRILLSIFRWKMNLLLVFLLPWEEETGEMT